MAIVSLVDKTMAGDRRDGYHLEIVEERLTLRELIRRRVFQEVAEHNASQSPTFQGLVRPTDTERALNSSGMRAARRIDPEEQFASAIAAFGRNRFVVLVGDHQVEHLDDEIELRQGSEITFLKLVALVGG